MMLTALDPGADTGFATFKNNALITCGLGAPIYMGGDVVIELPQVYRNSKARPQDLITLAVVVGELKANAESRGAKVKLVWPHDWKGSLKKEVMGRRIISRLDDVELEILGRTACLASKRHNIIDAIGLGLWALGRL